jgi:hypothetical protein
MRRLYSARLSSEPCLPTVGVIMPRIALAGFDVADSDCLLRTRREFVAAQPLERAPIE